jgi:hypothetical protein
VTALDVVAGGCTLCGSPDFERGGFGARTMIICDQCEREFHIGCLKAAGRCDLDKLPEGAAGSRCLYVRAIT